jgi:hypothetical protein
LLAVDESDRGANEAENMAKEMERILKEFPTTTATTTNSKSSSSSSNSNQQRYRHSSYPLPTFDDYTTSYPLPPSQHQHQQLSSISPPPPLPLPPPSSTHNNVPTIEAVAISPEVSCDIRYVIHPPPLSSSSSKNNNKNNNCDDGSISHSSSSTTISRTNSHRSSSLSSSRDLFCKQSSVYLLKGSSNNNNNTNTKSKTPRTRTRTAIYTTRRSWRTVLIYVLVFTLISCTTTFIIHWKVCNSEKGFNDVIQDSTTKFIHALKQTTKVAQTTKYYYANEQIIEYYYAPLAETILVSTQRTANLYLNTTMYDETKESIMNSIQAMKTYTLESITMTDETKASIVNNIHSTRTYVVGTVTSSFDAIINKSIPMITEGIAGYYLTTFTNNKVTATTITPTTIFQITMECLQSIKIYLVDKFQYTFTNRKEIEERKIEEEKIMKELLAVVAADATAKAEVAKQQQQQQQQMLTTTIFAGVCAFLGSVATNYIWAAM